MTNMLCVALGGAVGAVLRYLASLLIGSAQKGCFPWATFAVNIAGCLAIGLLAALLAQPAGGVRTEQLRLLLITGVCGGFTTFSTFSRESVALISEGHMGMFAAYAAGSVALGLAAVVAGMWAGRALA